MRPRQWIKNVFLFAGMVFTGHTADPAYLIPVLKAFAVFCALSSGLYLYNDIKDRREDRKHPRKRYRPIASGRLTPGFAAFAGTVIIVFSLWAAWGLRLAFFYVAFAYLLLTLAYTYGLKRVVLLDLFLLAANFVLRAVAGAVVIQVKISPWLLICTTLIALFLGLGKRRHELVLLSEDAGAHRRTLEEYNLPFLDQLLSIVTAATLMAYALYAFSSETAESHHQRMLLTAPFVMYGLFRYLYLIQVKSKGGSPEETILEDPASLVNFFLWTVTVLAIFKWG
jgi:4-hydroxybenzoate polyprenyltransferase